MWLFCLFDPGQIRYRAIYTHPNQIPGYVSGYRMSLLLVEIMLTGTNFIILCNTIRYFITTARDKAA